MLSKEKLIKDIKDILKNYWEAFNAADKTKTDIYKKEAQEFNDRYDLDSILSQEEFKDIMSYKESVKHGKR